MRPRTRLQHKLRIRLRRTRKRRGANKVPAGRTSQARNRRPTENCVNLLLHFAPHADHRTAGHLVAAQVIIEAYIDRDRSVDRLDDIVKRNLLGRTRQRITAAGTAFRFEQPAANQVLNNLFQKLARYALLLRDFGDGATFVAVLSPTNKSPRVDRNRPAAEFA